MLKIISQAEHGEIKCYKIKNFVHINNIEQLIESAARKHFPECFNCSFILSGIYITGDAMNYKKLTQQYLHQWMTENNLTGDITFEMQLQSVYTNGGTNEDKII